MAAGHLRVWIDDWQAEQVGEAMHLEARDEGLGLDLTLTPLKPPALHGEGGLSRKAELSVLSCLCRRNRVEVFFD